MRVAINHGIAQEFFRLLPEGSRDIEALRQGLSGFWLVGFGQGEGQVIVLGCSAQPRAHNQKVVWKKYDLIKGDSVKRHDLHGAHGAWNHTIDL